EALRFSEGRSGKLWISGEAGGCREGAPGGAEGRASLDGSAFEFDSSAKALGDKVTQAGSRQDRRVQIGIQVTRIEPYGNRQLRHAFVGPAVVPVGEGQDHVRIWEIRIPCDRLLQFVDGRLETARERVDISGDQMAPRIPVILRDG